MIAEYISIGITSKVEADTALTPLNLACLKQFPYVERLMNFSTTRNDLTDQASHEREFSRPKVIVSECLLSRPVRWDGDTIECRPVQRLMEYADLVAVCPEMRIGLGVPRQKIHLYRNGNEIRLFQSSSRLDITSQMRDLAFDMSNDIASCDGAIMKAKSPSCGIDDVKLYSDKAGEHLIGRTTGIFAQTIINNAPDLLVANEKQLEDSYFAFHYFAALYHRAELRLSPDTNPPGEGLFKSIVNSTPDVASHIRFLEGAYDRHKSCMAETDAADCLKRLEMLRNDRQELVGCHRNIRDAIHRSGQDITEDLSYWQPFPDELIELTDRPKTTA